MDFSLTEEQTMIRDSCRQFMTQRYALESWTRVAAGGGFGRENWQELADLGYLAIGLPEEHGGMGGVVELSVVCQEFGRGLLLEPFIDSAVLASRLISVAGSKQQQATLLPSMARGDCIVTLAHAEGDQREGDSLGTHVREDAEGYVLSGQKSLVVGGAEADWLIVSARSDGVRSSRSEGVLEGGSVVLLLVDPKAPGVSSRKVPLVDQRSCIEVQFEGVRISKEQRLPGRGEEALADGLRHATLAACAELVGVADRAFELAVEYLKGRTQFGVSLASLQALRHRVADLAIDREIARATLLLLLASFQDPKGYDPALNAALAKAQLGRLCRRVCAQAIQLHGAMGMTAECGVGRFFARANVLNSLYGQTDAQFDAYARLLTQNLRKEATQRA